MRIGLCELCESEFTGDYDLTGCKCCGRMFCSDCSNDPVTYCYECDPGEDEEEEDDDEEPF